MDVPAEKLMGDRHIITVVGQGANLTSGSVTVHTKALNSSQYFPLKDPAGNAIVLNLANTDQVVNGAISGVKLDVASLAGSGASDWYFVVSPI
jgi:hypothetical protein